MRFMHDRTGADMTGALERLRERSDFVICAFGKFVALDFGQIMSA